MNPLFTDELSVLHNPNKTPKIAFLISFLGFALRHLYVILMCEYCKSFSVFPWATGIGKGIHTYSSIPSAWHQSSQMFAVEVLLVGCLVFLTRLPMAFLLVTHCVLHELPPAPSSGVVTCPRPAQLYVLVAIVSAMWWQPGWDGKTSQSSKQSHNRQQWQLQQEKEASTVWTDSCPWDPGSLQAFLCFCGIPS